MNAHVTLARRAAPIPSHTLPENKAAIVPFYNLARVSEFAEAMVGKAMLAEAKGLTRPRIVLGAYAKQANGNERSERARREIKNAMRHIGHPCKRGEIEKHISAIRMSDRTMYQLIDAKVVKITNQNSQGHNLYALTEWDE